MSVDPLSISSTTPQADPARRPLLCVSITGTTPAKLEANSAALIAAFPFQELRLDFLSEPAAALPTLQRLLQTHPNATLLATCRPLTSGGKFLGSPQRELDLLASAAQAGVPLVDLSLESAEALGPTALTHLRAQGAKVLLSFHDFQATPDLRAVLARMHAFEPDLYKIVPTAQTLSDALDLLHFLRTTAATFPEPLVALAMGESGIPTRILGPRFGSAFTFAAPNPAEATAPGQLTARTLTDLYRIDRITPATHLYGVAGDPIHSSLSPPMLNTAFREANLDAAYLPLKTGTPEELLRAARELPLQGFSVTMPLKQAILPFLNHVDPIAACIGAVNTVHRTPDGRLLGYNTDAAGIVVPLERRLPLRHTRILVLGAGGAARAAVFACLDRGAHVFIHNRTPATALHLAQQAGATAISHEALLTERFDVLINATPAGMRGNPLTLPLTDAELHADLIFDLVYNPLDTPLLALARAQGLQVIPGLEMFVHQGARQFELWTGQPAPLESMRGVVLRALASPPARPPAAAEPLNG